MQTEHFANTESIHTRMYEKQDLFEIVILWIYYTWNILGKIV